MGMSQSTPTTPAGLPLMRPPIPPQTADVLQNMSAHHPPGQPPTAFPFPQHQQIRMQQLQTMTPTNAGPGGLTPGYPPHGQLTSPISRLGDVDGFSMHSESPTPSGGRPGSSASMGFGGFETGIMPPVKSGRGRKRKKPLEEFPEQFMRSPMLGSVHFGSLQSDFERDIYDTLDSMITRVERMADGGDPNSLRRLLYTHAPPDLIDGQKAKKKRQPMKKVAPVEYNEYELTLERILHALKMCPPIPPRAFEPNSMIDKHLLQTRETTHWPDRPDKPPIMGHTLGNYKLTFMEDYYTTLENVEAEEEAFYPPPMGEIYRDVSLRNMSTEEDDDFEEDPFWTENDEDMKNGVADPNGSMPRPDLYNLTLGSLGDRTRIPSATYPNVRKLPEKIVPLEPHRSHFFYVRKHRKILIIRCNNEELRHLPKTVMKESLYAKFPCTF